MSDRLAIASAFSVLMMSAYALLGQDAARMPLAGDSMTDPVGISITAELPEPSDLLPLLR